MNELEGLILCGGKSSRMGEDKAFIAYHASPQYIYLYEMLSQFIPNVYLSCNNSQKIDVFSNRVVIDQDLYKGPLNGILSYHNKFPARDVLVLACDLPFVNYSQVEIIINLYLKTNETVVTQVVGSDFYEPLFSIYKADFLNHIMKDANQGLFSLQKIISKSNNNVILNKVEDGLKLFNANSPTDKVNAELRLRNGK